MITNDRIARGARGGIQYRCRSKALGCVRKVSSAALGFAANRTPGRVMGFTLRGIRHAMAPTPEMSRDECESGAAVITILESGRAEA